MKISKSDSGSVFVFVMLILVFLMVLVGMGVDTGWLTYVRSQGQPAVDASALAAASALSTGDIDKVHERAVAFNATNDYPGGGSSGPNQITSANVQLVSYDHTSGNFTVLPDTDIASANGARVALEQANDTAIRTRFFLIPLMNFFRSSTSGNANVNVSAIAALKAVAELPMYLKTCPPDPSCTDNGDGTYSCVLQIYQNPDPTENTGWTVFFEPNPSTPTIIDLVDNPDCKKIPPLSVGDNICRNNGTVTPVVKAIVNKYGKNPNRCFFVPVADGTSTCQTTVSGFADICIQDGPPVEDGIAIYAPGKKPAPYPNGPTIMEASVKCGVELFKATECSIPVLVREPSAGM